jgi:hypothetical protein
MKVYQSKNAAHTASIAFTVIVVIAVIITLIYFRSHWYFLFVFITPFFLISLIIPELMSSFYTIKDGYLIKYAKNYNHNPWKTYKLDTNGRRNYDETVFSMKLTDIIRIEKRKDVFRTPFIALYYSDNQAVDIYLKTGEIEDFIKAISEKQTPSVFHHSLSLKL